MTSAFFLRRLLLGARGPRIWWIGAKVTLVATCLQIAWIAWQTAPRLGDALLGQVHLIAYVDAGTGPDDLRGLGETLRRLPTVRDVHLVDPATALKRLQTEFASRRLNGATSASLRVEEGFLPGSVEIALKVGPNLVIDADALATRLQRLPHILAVDRVPDATNRIATWRRLLNSLGVGALVLGGILCLVTGVFVLLRLRRQHAARVATLTLLGATTFDLHATAILGGALICGLGVVSGQMLGQIAMGAVTQEFLSSWVVARPAVSWFGFVAVAAVGGGAVLGALTVPSIRPLA